MAALWAITHNGLARMTSEQEIQSLKAEIWALKKRLLEFEQRQAETERGIGYLKNILSGD